MRTERLSLLLSLVVTGCGGAEEKSEMPTAPVSSAQPIASTQATAPPPSGTASSAPPPLETKLPPAVTGPASVACILGATEWTAGTIRLRLAGKDEPFATVNRPESVKVTFPSGKPQDAALYELDLGSAVVRAVVAGDEVPLYAKAPVALGGFVVPLGSTRLTWTTSAVDSITFQVDAGTMVKATTELATAKPCAYFSLTAGRFDPIAATGSPAQGRSGILRPLKNTLSGSSDGTAVAELNVTDSAQKVAILAVSGNRSRIAWQTQNHLLFGWVPTSALVNTTEALSIGGAPPEPPKAPAKRITAVPTWEKRICNTELPLVAEYKNEIRAIGTVKAKKGFELGPARAGWRMVSLPESDLVASSGATFFVPRAAAEQCNSMPLPL